MFPLTSWLVFASVLSSSQLERPSYEAAYQKAQEEHKPLLVVVGADWCAACKIMKSETIEPMQTAGQLENVVVTIVDKDRQPDLAEKLMDGKTLPQLVVFAKGNEGWKKFSVAGIQSQKRVQELIEKARAEAAPRTASLHSQSAVSQR